MQDSAEGTFFRVSRSIGGSDVSTSVRAHERALILN